MDVLDLQPTKLVVDYDIPDAIEHAVKALGIPAERQFLEVDLKEIPLCGKGIELKYVYGIFYEEISREYCTNVGVQSYRYIPYGDKRTTIKLADPLTTLLYIKTQLNRLDDHHFKSFGVIFLIPSGKFCYLTVYKTDSGLCLKTLANVPPEGRRGVNVIWAMVPA